MHRRTYLGTLAAAALAGCTSAPAGSAPSNGTVDDFPYTLADVQTDPAPVDDVTIEVTVTEDFTTDRPARLDVAFTNDADDARTFTFGALVPWDTLRGLHEDDSASLVLSPDGDVAPEEPIDGCWRATDGIALPAVMREQTVESGETVTSEFRVLAAHDSENCHPVGTYRFEDGSYLGEGWGFDVRVVSAPRE